MDWVNDDLKKVARDIKPNWVLAFATGSKKVPAGGLSPAGRIVFRTGQNKALPEASTCANELALTLTGDFNDFSNDLCMALHAGYQRFFRC